MEATIIAAVVTAGGSFLSKLLDLHANNPDAKTRERAASVAQKTYDVLRRNLTDGSVRLLTLLESGSLLYPHMIRERLYPSLQVPRECLHEFDAEFHYRLEYLRLNGLLQLVAGREYGITVLGLAFLEEARRRRDYLAVLFGS
jgi:hypothetical protein